MLVEAALEGVEVDRSGLEERVYAVLRQKILDRELVPGAVLTIRQVATVLGVSPDPAEAVTKFAAKYKLNFPLLADQDHAVCEKYGVWQQKSMYGRKYMGIERRTYLIDSQGVVRRIWRKVKVPGHVAEVLEAAKAIR